MSEELKPCPFCGSNAHLHARGTGAPRPSYQVQCAECYAGTTNRYEEPPYAYAAWNRRAPDLKLQAAEALNAELVGALRPFAAVAPSSFYAEDGSERERYTVRLYDSTHHEPPHDFTGEDLARARAALAKAEAAPTAKPAT